jgi:hypothetical protein
MSQEIQGEIVRPTVEPMTAEDVEAMLQAKADAAALAAKEAAEDVERHREWEARRLAVGARIDANWGQAPGWFHALPIAKQRLVGQHDQGLLPPSPDDLRQRVSRLADFIDKSSPSADLAILLDDVIEAIGAHPDTGIVARRRRRLRPFEPHIMRTM